MRQVGGPVYMGWANLREGGRARGVAYYKWEYIYLLSFDGEEDDYVSFCW